MKAANIMKRTVAGVTALSVVSGAFAVYDSETLAKAADKTLYGDFNCDGKVDIDDVIGLSEYLKDPASVKYTEQGLINADALNPGTILDYDDAQVIIENLTGQRTLWTNGKNEQIQNVVYGDADCDGDVDFDDVKALNNYLKDPDANPLTPEGLTNADALNPGTILDHDDVQVIIENLAGLRSLWASGKNEQVQNIVYGDADCDGDVDFDDVEALNKYLKDADTNPLTPEGLKNADALNPGTILDYGDVQVIIENLAGQRTLWANGKNEQVQETVHGDADCDGDVDFDDIEALNKYLKDPDANPLTPEGLKNADVYNEGTILDAEDLQAIFESLTVQRSISGTGAFTLPAENITYNTEAETLYGDFNCDGKVDSSDVDALKAFISKPKENKISAASARNGNVYDPDTTGLTKEDITALEAYVSSGTAVPVYTVKKNDVNYGDFNCDNKVNMVDVKMLNLYLEGVSDYKPSAQGIKNANVYRKDSTELDRYDMQAITEFLAKKTTLPAEELAASGYKPSAGDFNCDNKVDIVDVKMLNQYLEGITAYQPSDQGLENANVYKKDSTKLDIDDIRAITESIASKTALPVEELAPYKPKLLYGDFNCDTKVDFVDVKMLNQYLEGITAYQPSAQGLENANAYKPDSTKLDTDDVQAITEFIAKKNTLPAEEFAPSVYHSVHGDFNCDNNFNIIDAIMYYRYIEKISAYVPSEQGKKNANISGSDKDLNYDDLLIMINLLKAPAKEKTDLSKCNGDVNEDGKINSEDLVYLRKVLLGSEKYKETCDVNGDDSFSTLDFVILKMIIVKPVEE